VVFRRELRMIRCVGCVSGNPTRTRHNGTAMAATRLQSQVCSLGGGRCVVQGNPPKELSTGKDKKKHRTAAGCFCLTAQLVWLDSSLVLSTEGCVALGPARERPALFLRRQ
jgi:hypothetical protein